MGGEMATAIDSGAADSGTPVGQADSKTRHAIIIGAIIGAAATILGTIVGFAIPSVTTAMTGPPSENTVIALMDQEVDAGRSRSLGIVDRIYDSDATVTDAACRTPGASQSWHGRGEVETRYKGVPAFVSLYHVDVHVTWEPANRDASRAEATADTIGVFAPTSTSPMGQAVYGHELWVLIKSGDQWVIQSFIYNLCLQ